MPSRTTLRLLAPTLLVGLSLLSLPEPAVAQVPAAPAEPAAQTSPAAQPDLAAIDRFITQARADWAVPGLAVAIVKDGRTVFAKGYGVRAAGSSEPVDEHTLFAIASNTKAFTSAALATLVDEGKLSWDDRVRDHLPYFLVYDRGVSEEMRIRDLLSHRSGLGTYSGDVLWWGAPLSAEEVVRRAQYLPQAGAFRASYNYSNLMFIAAGEVVAAASGRSWAQYVRDEILQPVGMQRTVLTIDSLAARDNVASPHKVIDGRNTPIPWHGWNAMGAAGSIISSVSDMSQWLQLQLRGGLLPDGDTLFSPTQQWTMWTVHTPLAVPPSMRTLYPSTHFRGYGLGWSLNDYEGRRLVSHGGAYDGMYSRVLLVPEEGLGMVVLTNSMTGISNAITNHIVDLYLGAEPRDWSGILREREEAGNRREAQRRADFVRVTLPNTKPALPLASYAGTYTGPMLDVSVTLENGGLVLRLPHGELVADLRHRQLETFLIDWRREWAWFEDGVATFVLDEAGKVVELKLNVPNQDIFFEELVLKRE